MQWAHSTAFALITDAISNTSTVKLDARIREYAADRIDQVRAFEDIAHVLVWHAAGAILRAADGDTDQALQIVREGALQQATTTIEGETD